MRTIVLLAVIALGGVSLIMGDTNYRHHYGVSFENDTCKYRNQTLKDGGFETLQYPCELWLCNATAKTLTVEGCNVRRYGSCVYVHNPHYYWPRCCPRYPIC
uniref:Putative secreted salivary peptide of 9.41 kDa n=1 Tax=Ixodes pacificus TaxID=29930 RepID=Q6B8H0_IXOPA|nr:putative secreted salivary peptide of 9.41 kDa [Ixodes pacificus]